MIDTIKRSLEQIEKNVVYLFAITIFGAILRFRDIASESLWLDELVTVDFTLGGIRNIFESCMQMDWLPLYPSSLWIWTRIFGFTDSTVRAFSATIGVAGILALYFLGKKLFSKQVGLAAALFLSVSRFHIVYSREARSFILVFLLAVLSYLALLRQIEKPTIKNSILYILSTSLMMYTHYFGLLILPSQIVFLLYTFGSVRKDKKFLKFQGFSFLGAGILFLPWLPVMLRGIERGVHWVKSPKPDFFLSYFNDLFGNEPFLTVVFSVLLLVYVFTKSEKAGFDQHKIFLITWIFIPLFIPYVWSFNNQSPLLFRYIIILFPAFLIIGASALYSLKENAARNFVITVIFLVSLVNIFYTHGNFYTTTYKGRWREAAKFAAVKCQLKDYWIYGHKYFDYYLNFVYKQDVHIGQAIFADHRETEVVLDKLINGRRKGVWILEAGALFDSYLHEYFNQHLIKSESVALFNAQATLYIKPKDYKISLKPLSIPVNWLGIEGNISNQESGFIDVEGDFQISTPDLVFDKGTYELSIQAEGRAGQTIHIRIPSTEIESRLTLEDGRKDYSIRVDCPSALKAPIIIMSPPHSRQNLPVTKISGIQVQRIQNLGDFLKDLKQDIEDTVVILSVKDDAKNKLNAASLRGLQNLGLKKIINLRFRESYLAVIKEENIVFEEKEYKRIGYSEKGKYFTSAGWSSGNSSH
ncbi:glycosyltransferase family 39 protein, partial [Acidobacteriota bacterium]